MQQRAREREKLPDGTGRFCLSALRTKSSRMFLLRLKQIRGLSVKMVIFKNLKITANDVTITLQLKILNVRTKGILSSEILAKGGFRVSGLNTETFLNRGIYLRNGSDRRRANTRNFIDFTICIGSHPNLLIFRIVSLLCLCSLLCFIVIFQIIKALKLSLSMFS